MGKARVLLVDDDTVCQKLVAAILGEEGFTMCPGIASGEEVEAAVSACDPDLVLMDISLSGRLDGIEAAAMLRATHDVPVVYLTAHTDSDVVERIKATAPYGFVSKPVRAEQLVATVETALNRHRQDRQVRESHSWLSTVLGCIGDAVISVDPRGRITFANRSARELVGRSSLGESLGSALPLVDPAENRLVTALLERSLAQGGSAEMDEPLALEAEEAGPLTVRIAVYPLADDGEQSCGAVVVLRDVTTEQRLLEELRSFKLVVDSMQIGVTITDLDRRILYVNPAEAEMHGFRAEELTGRSARVLGARKATALQSTDSQDLGRWQRSAVNVRKDGSRFPVQLYSDVVRDEHGAPVALVTCSEDMSDRLQADEQIRKLYRAVEQSPNLVVITDVDGRIEYVNPRFTEVTGFTAEEAIGQNPSMLKSDRMDPSVYEDLWQTITRGGTWSSELLNRRKDGSLYWCIASISGLRDDRGEVRHYVGVQQDITARKEMELELAEKNAELERLSRLKSELVAVTSHDLKSPLHAMVSLASLLKEMGGRLDQQTTDRYVDQIIASGHRLSRFISEILDAERVESGTLSLDLEPVRLEHILNRCVEVARAEGRDKGLQVSLSIETRPATTLGDPVRLEQVFTNILGNAVKLSPEGAQISVVVAGTRDSVEVAVYDQGPGIPEQDLESIFDRYYQVARNGAVPERGFGVGLGLYITRKLVNLHGGAIHAENRSAGGCRFVVWLPIRTLADSGEGLSALVLDHGGWMGGWLEGVLRRKNVTPIVVSSPGEAERAARDRPPSIVLARRVSESPDVRRAFAAIAAMPGRTPRLVSIESREPEGGLPPEVTVLVAPVADSEIFELLREVDLEARQGSGRS